jgi:hypothetical protein
MAGLVKITDRYSPDVELAKRSTRVKYSFIVSNMHLLDRVDRTGSHERFLDTINDDVEADRMLLNWQMARVEKIYELVMKAAGHPSVPEHQDRRRKGLRFG